MSAAGTQGIPFRVGWAVQPRLKPTRLAEWFVILEFVCQLALLSDSLSALRLFWRTAVFATSLCLVAVIRRPVRAHPAAGPALWVMAILALGLLNPELNSYLGAAAQGAMYLAILGPLFWASRLRIDPAEVRRVLVLEWIFHAASAAVGILQVYFPGRFQPHMSAVMAAPGEETLEELTYVNAFGQRVFRPMGLTDVPGGAAFAGQSAVLLGLFFFVSEARAGMRLLAAATVVIGFTCIYLSQERVALAVTIITAGSFVLLLVLRSGQARAMLARLKRLRARAVAAAVLAFVLAVVAFSWAAGVGGEAVSKRFSTLLPSQASQTYQQSRGGFLRWTFEEGLWRYPLGAGPGRWGMMYYYFGDHSAKASPPLWAEIQWQGWLLDGGLPLMAAYLAALWAAFRFAWRLARNQWSVPLAAMGAFVFAWNVGGLAATFDADVFNSQGGLEVWLLNALVFAAARETFAARGSPMPPVRTTASSPAGS